MISRGGRQGDEQQEREVCMSTGHRAPEVGKVQQQQGREVYDQKGREIHGRQGREVHADMCV